METNYRITLRETLTKDIFDELKEKYPTVSDKGIEYKQTCSFCGVPSDFDLETFSIRCEDNNINVCNSFTIFVMLLLKMSSSHGFYFISNRLLPREISLTTSLDGAEIQKILDFLIEYEYIYNFDNKITSIITVRNYECIMDSRRNKRNDKRNERKEKTKKSDLSDEKDLSDLIEETDFSDLIDDTNETKYF